MSVTVKEKVSVNRRISQINGGIPVVIRAALEDMKRISTPITPYLDGPLRADVKIRVQGRKGTIKWGKKYAAYQERGRRLDGTHVVKRYTTPGTGKHFVKRSAKQMMKKYKKYFRKARLSQ